VGHRAYRRRRGLARLGTLIAPGRVARSRRLGGGDAALPPGAAQLGRPARAGQPVFEVIDGGLRDVDAVGAEGGFARGLPQRGGGVGFQVLDPPELIPVLRTLSDRLRQAAEASASGRW
jgi:hypothetical protein